MIGYLDYDVLQDLSIVGRDKGSGRHPNGSCTRKRVNTERTGKSNVLWLMFEVKE